MFRDPDLMQSNSSFLTGFLSKIIVALRLKRVQKQYQEIGGGSPILKWTEAQGQAMAAILNREHAGTASFRPYVAFRYVQPDTFTALRAMENDGVDHIVVLSNYPQYSCTTTGSSLTHIWQAAAELQLKQRFSLIDRWNTEPLFIKAICERITERLKSFSAPEKAVIVFSAHSLPIKTVNRGDSYVHEVHRTVSEVMRTLENEGVGNRYIVAWQSKVGPVEWLGPTTSDVLTRLGASGEKRVLVVPVAFTNDHIETLYEIDLEYRDLAAAAGVTEFFRTEGLNDSETFAQCLAKLVSSHLKKGQNYSQFYRMKCAKCWQPDVCRRITNAAFPVVSD